jgi:plasmid replication initiation protein
MDATDVEDGDLIEVEVISLLGNFKCCETQRDCNYQAPAIWIQKSNKDRKTITLNKEALLRKVKFAAERVRGKRTKKRS